MKVPRIVSETGVSADYWDNYLFKACLFRSGLWIFTKDFREYPIMKYGQKFPPENFEDVITDTNRDRVSRLNELCDIANNTFSDHLLFIDDDFKKLINEVHALIFSTR